MIEKKTAAVLIVALVCISAVGVAWAYPAFFDNDGSHTKDKHGVVLLTIDQAGTKPFTSASVEDAAATTSHGVNFYYVSESSNALYFHYTDTMQKSKVNFYVEVSSTNLVPGCTLTLTFTQGTKTIDVPVAFDEYGSATVYALSMDLQYDESTKKSTGTSEINMKINTTGEIKIPLATLTVNVVAVQQ